MAKLEDLENQTIIFSEEKQKYEILGVPKISLFDIINLCECEESDLIKLLIALGLVKDMNQCPNCCKELTKLYFNRNTPFKRCNTKICNRPKLFLFKDTVFEQAKLPAKTVLWLLYYFSCRRTAGDVSQTLFVSRDTVKTFYDLFRALLFRFCDMTSVQLGGPVVNVHLDVTPITKRHAGRGREAPSNTVWVIGAVDIFNRKCVLCFLPSRGRCHVIPFIENWLAPRSVLTTDCLATYRILNEIGFTHHSVNHSKHLVAPDGTNRIEGVFGSVKRMMRSYNFKWSTVESLNTMLGEWCFRYCNDAWDRGFAFGKICAAIRYVLNN